MSIYNKIAELKKRIATPEAKHVEIGPKGGKIIGHTKSGKPIYQEGNKGAKGWSPQDHRDAYDAHQAHSFHHEDALEPTKEAWRDKNPGGSITDFHDILEHGHHGPEAQAHAKGVTHHRNMMENHWQKFKGKL